MDRHGFSLIELLVTIALLAVISMISVVSINAIIKQNKKNDCETLVNNIEIAAKEYVSDHRYDASFNGSGITAQTLISNNYLSSPIYNPFNNNEQLSPEGITLTITLKGDKTVSSVVVNGIDCNY